MRYRGGRAGHASRLGASWRYPLLTAAFAKFFGQQLEHEKEPKLNDERENFLFGASREFVR